MNNPKWKRIIISLMAYLVFVFYLMYSQNESVITQILAIAFLAFMAFLIILAVMIVFAIITCIANGLLKFWGCYDLAERVSLFMKSFDGFFISAIAAVLIVWPIAIVLQNPYRFPMLHGIFSTLLSLNK